MKIDAFTNTSLYLMFMLKKIGECMWGREVLGKQSVRLSLFIDSYAMFSRVVS